MDATAMYPEGFHPIRLDCHPRDLRRWAPVRSRDDVPVTYYFVDFGISSQFQPSDTDRLVVGTLGLDQDVPELSDEVPYDPFKVDIFILGNFFSQEFVGVSIPRPLYCVACTHRIARNTPTSAS